MSNKIYQIAIETKVKAKERPRKGRYGNFYTPRKTQNSEYFIRLIVKKEYPKIRPETGQFIFMFTIFQKLPRPDIDNIIKTIMDALDGVVYLNDSRVQTLLARKYYPESDLIIVTWKKSSEIFSTRYPYENNIEEIKLNDLKLFESLFGD